MIVAVFGTADPPTWWGVPVGDALVAGGTLALALFTAALAGVTWRDVKDTHRLAVIAREAHEARYEPFLVAILGGATRGGGSVIEDVSFELWNVGVGAALNVEASIIVRTDDGEVSLNEASPQRFALIQATEMGLVSGKVGHLGVVEQERVWVRGTYTDRAHELKSFP